MSERLEKLYAEMAELTLPKCAGCRSPHSCCSPEYCLFAEEEAKMRGVELQRTEHPVLPFMSPAGCIVPPHLRPMCTLHVCSIAGLGFDPTDKPFTKNYYELREEIMIASYEDDPDLQDEPESPTSNQP